MKFRRIDLRYARRIPPEDYRTAGAQCATDLATLIEVGDFQRFDKAERLLNELVASLSNRQRGPALALLAMQLARFVASD